QFAHIAVPHTLPLHVCPTAVQLTHASPPVPHWLFIVPSKQIPPTPQHPIAHVEGPHPASPVFASPASEPDATSFDASAAPSWEAPSL
ncbi:hypothetical protein, partial [Klebsiella pneumoniae]|uniref:hypothetical protein n=1 Tax=Klebsiella pneumoniae TaxID=573 RepID=UPI003EE27BAA